MPVLIGKHSLVPRKHLIGRRNAGHVEQAPDFIRPRIDSAEKTVEGDLHSVEAKGRKDGESEQGPRFRTKQSGRAEPSAITKGAESDNDTNNPNEPGLVDANRTVTYNAANRGADRRGEVNAILIANDFREA